jgi:hypothetical protein
LSFTRSTASMIIFWFAATILDLSGLPLAWKKSISSL